MNLKVLFVTTSPSARARYIRVLLDEGLDVVTATSFKTALEMTRRARPALLVTDVKLAEYNGLDLASRAREAGLDTPVLVIGDPRIDLAGEAAAGGAAYVVDHGPDAVLAAARQLLGHAATRHERRAPRLRLTRQIQAQLAGTSVRLVDVSYTGMRFDASGMAEVRSGDTMRLNMPDAGVSTDVEAVWSLWDAARARLLFGASVVPDKDEYAAWRTFVDSLSRTG
jgi:DNA-binding NtrC family response regulator